MDSTFIFSRARGFPENRLSTKPLLVITDDFLLPVSVVMGSCFAETTRSECKVDNTAPERRTRTPHRQQFRAWTRAEPMRSSQTCAAFWYGVAGWGVRP